MDFSTGWVFASLLVSTVGFGLFIYGKKQLRIPQLVSGILLMTYPAFLASPAWILVVGAAIVGSLWMATRAGI